MLSSPEWDVAKYEMEQHNVSLVTLLHFDQFIYCIVSLLQHWNSALALKLLPRHSFQSANNLLSLLLRQTEIRRNK